MRLLDSVGLGAAASVVAWLSARGVFSSSVFTRQNFRGATVPVGAGVLLAVAMIAADAVIVVSDRVVDHHANDLVGTALVLAAVLGFCVLGLLDDLAATGEERGFGGHLRALAQGRLTTGGLKLVGGGLLALVLAGWARRGGVIALLVDTLLIALAANTGNLFDRAPGRTIKVGGLALAVVLALASTEEHQLLTGVAILLGAALGLLVFDLREDLMLGDAGSNAIGAGAGVGVVLTCGLAARVAVLVLVLGLNLASERISFTRVIDSVAPLRFLDRWGRRST